MKLFAIMLSALLFCSVCNTTEHNPVRVNEVSIETGLISGCLGKNTSVKVFKGIPFAAPPIGELRWRPPVKAKFWQGIRKCDAFSAKVYWDRPWQDVDYKLSEIMTSYWSNFAATGNPNGAGLATWPAFDTATQKVMIFSDTVHSDDLPHKKQLKFFDSLVVNKK